MHTLSLRAFPEHPRVSSIVAPFEDDDDDDDVDVDDDGWFPRFDLPSKILLSPLHFLVEIYIHLDVKNSTFSSDRLVYVRARRRFAQVRSRRRTLKISHENNITVSASSA